MLELQVSQREMLHDFVTLYGERRILMGPPLTKFGADLSEILNQFLEPGVTWIERTGRVKLCQDASRQLFPIGIACLVGGAGEEPPDQIT